MCAAPQGIVLIAHDLFVPLFCGAMVLIVAAVITLAVAFGFLLGTPRRRLGLWLVGVSVCCLAIGLATVVMLLLR